MRGNYHNQYSLQTNSKAEKTKCGHTFYGDRRMNGFCLTKKFYKEYPLLNTNVYVQLYRNIQNLSQLYFT